MKTKEQLVAIEAEREAVVRFLRAEQAYYERGSTEAVGQDVREQCRAKESALSAAAEAIERGDHRKGDET